MAQNIGGGERADPRIVAAEETCDPHGMGGAGSVPTVDATGRVPPAYDDGGVAFRFHNRAGLCYTISQMKTGTTVLLLFSTTFAWASGPAALSLPPVAHADTEVVTNVVISSWQRGAAKFAFSLSCLATPSNNVEAASRIENVKCKV